MEQDRSSGRGSPIAQDLGNADGREDDCMARLNATALIMERNLSLDIRSPIETAISSLCMIGFEKN